MVASTKHIYTHCPFSMFSNQWELQCIVIREAQTGFLVLWNRSI